MSPVPLDAELQVTTDTRLSQPRKSDGPEKAGDFEAALARMLSGTDEADESGPATTLPNKNNAAAKTREPEAGAEGAEAGAGPEHSSGSKVKKLLKDASPDKKQLEAMKDGKAFAAKSATKAGAKAENSTVKATSGERVSESKIPDLQKDGEVADSRRKGLTHVETPSVKVPSVGGEDAGAAIAVVHMANQAAATPLNVFATEADGSRGGVQRHAGRPGHESPKVVLELRDYRNAESVRVAMADGQTGSTKGETADDKSANGDRDSGDFQLRMFRFAADRGDGSAPVTSRSAGGGAFSAYLRENLNNQIVRQSGIILRNNNRGEIRLVLKPENLGRVRLRIQLDDHRLSGRIFVDSALVKEAFEQNLPSLYRTFRNNGFDASGFEVLVDGGEGNGSSPQGSPDSSSGRTPAGAAVLNTKTAQQLGDAVPILEEIGWQSDLVNLVV